ncbi:DUF1688 family protein [Kaistia terrae]|uniref:DUF1688 family protein n=1 Tax=Kaistia terrae TaxID=537017 RepID=A0ABW0PWZ7_9HYPH|nr:DUF1688 family protein [Kaistia terrae]
MAAISSLLSASAVRERANLLLELGIAGKLDHFVVDLKKLPAAADAVIETIRADYPDLDIPFHSRWRDFEAGQIDRFGGLVDAAGITDPLVFGRAAFDLAIVSVALDSDPGPDWHYHEAMTGETLSGSEGVGVASLVLFASGLFSQDPADPLRVDAAALAVLDAADLAEAFQVTPENPMAGLEDRVRLLNKLGRIVADRADLFGEGEARPGGLFAKVLATADEDGRVSALQIFDLVQEALGPLWPGSLLRDGVALGDTFEHAKLVTDDPTSGLVPLHQPAQWLSYSLIEPLLWTGVEVVDLDVLTGIPDDRIGTLFLDAGVLVPRHAPAGKRSLDGDEFTVEGRALTVALLDSVAVLVREKLGLDAEALPLAKVMQAVT